MPSKAEKERRKKLHLELAKREQDEFLKTVPMEKSVIIELFDFLDNKLEELECKHDYQLTGEFLKSKHVENENVYEWFREHGGYCDCEILFNIEERFED